MITLTPFGPADFSRFMRWIDSPELLITIAGTDLSFPVLEHQLQEYVDDLSSASYNLVFDDEVIGHAELKRTGPAMLKVDKLLIGAKSSRGKGFGELAIRSLLQESFEEFRSQVTELNVFENNHAAIRCYEKCGFVSNPSLRKPFQVNGQVWYAVNMQISREDWQRNLTQPKKTND